MSNVKMSKHICKCGRGRSGLGNEKLVLLHRSSLKGAWLAPSVQHMTLDLGVRSLNPTLDKRLPKPKCF